MKNCGDMDMASMIKDKKLAALRELIKQMFVEEGRDPDQTIDIEEVLADAVDESPEMMAEASDKEYKDDDMTKEMSEFFKQKRQGPVRGKTKSMMMSMEVKKPQAKTTRTLA
jgi:hypothetical protein